MKKNNPVARTEEQIIYALRDLYEAYGYSRFKMIKFEEYDFYVRNKAFLVSDSIITFNDTNGKLMALKPDVTLSIIKNTKDDPDGIRKVYYNENVYRVSKSSHSFKEIMQSGIEYIGDVDGYAIAEIINLAASSLKLISDESILSVTNLDILSEIIGQCTNDAKLQEEIFRLMGEKNTNALRTFCADNGISDENTGMLCEITMLHGAPADVLADLREMAPDCRGIDEFEKILRSVYPGLKDMIEVDFSYSGDIKYYNGITFKGYVNGIPESVLSGGQYDRLMQNMGRTSKAIGFAVYVGTLERLGSDENRYDIDTVLLYEENADLRKLGAAVKSIADKGVTVIAAKKIPEKLRYKKLMKFNGKGAELVETDA